MATHSRSLAWDIPQREEPGGLPSWGYKDFDMELFLDHQKELSKTQTNPRR